MAIQNSAELTPREYTIMQHDKEMLERQMQHAKDMKQLEIELQRLEAKWSAWLRIPMILITLPVRILFVIPLTVYAITKQEVPEFYHKWLR